jgi:hypothetical protein
MSSSTVIRLGGLAALVGFVTSGVIDAVWPFVFPDSVSLSALSVSDTWFVLHLLYIIALLIGLVGLFGIYARQAEQIGALGLIGVLMAFFGLALLFALEWAGAFILPVFAHAAPQFMDHPDQNLLQGLNASQIISTVLAFGGLILFAVASLRAAVLPRGAAVLVLAAAIVGMALNLVGVEVPLVSSLTSLLGTLGIAWMGYAVWSHPAVAAESTTSITASGPSVANR